jgi:hypothetical protein
MDNNLIAYYPNYSFLDNILSYSDYKTLNLYIDIRNILQPLYYESSVKSLIDTTKRARCIDSSIFASFLSFLSFHKKYAIKRNIDINFYAFFEIGQSYYHKNIDKNYKIRRKLDDLFGLDKVDKDLFVSIVQNNLRLIEKAFNKVPNIKIFKLENFEADFIPYYLIKNSLVPIQDACHIIYSNDHDMYQVLGLNKNIYQFIKSKDNRQVVKQNDVLSKYLKFKNTIPNEYFPLIMAVLGDKGDDVPKIKNIGPKTIPKIINKLIEMVGGMENLHQNVRDKKPIFNIDSINDKNLSVIIEEEKKNSLISNNLRLIWFEIIAEVFKDPPNTEIIQKRNYVSNVLNSNIIVESNTMYQALKKGNVEILEEDVDILFSNKNDYDFENF